MPIRSLSNPVAYTSPNPYRTLLEVHVQWLRTNHNYCGNLPCMDSPDCYCMSKHLNLFQKIISGTCVYCEEDIQQHGECEAVNTACCMLLQSHHITATGLSTLEGTQIGGRGEVLGGENSISVACSELSGRGANLGGLGGGGRECKRGRRCPSKFSGRLCRSISSSIILGREGGD